MGDHGSDNGEIRVVTNKQREFYRDIGPFLSRREIVRELGFNIWDDDRKVWYVMYQGETVVGFAAMIPGDKKTVFMSAYVPPEYRSRGIYSELLDARLSDVVTWPVTTTATDKSRPILESRGFVATGQRGRYTSMIKESGDV